VVLIDAGRQKPAAAFPVVRQTVNELFADHLGTEEADALVRILGRIRDRDKSREA
jgi:hypothetical protein